VVVGDERAQRCLSAVAVVPDGRRECEESLQNASGDPTWGSASMAFQIELGLERGVDRFDELTEGFEQRRGLPVALSLHGRTDQSGAVIGQKGLELGRGVALVGEDGLADTGGEEFGFDLEEVPVSPPAEY